MVLVNFGLRVKPGEGFQHFLTSDSNLACRNLLGVKLLGFLVDIGLSGVFRFYSIMGVSPEHMFAEHSTALGILLHSFVD